MLTGWRLNLSSPAFYSIFIIRLSVVAAVFIFLLVIIIGQFDIRVNDTDGDLGDSVLVLLGMAWIISYIILPWIGGVMLLCSKHIPIAMKITVLMGIIALLCLHVGIQAANEHAITREGSTMIMNKATIAGIDTYVLWHIRGFIYAGLYLLSLHHIIFCGSVTLLKRRIAIAMAIWCVMSLFIKGVILGHG